MRYIIVFRVNLSDSGKATYYANICGGFSPPYQKIVEQSRCEQEISYGDIKKLIEFIEKGFSEFGASFEIMHIYAFSRI